MWLAAVLTVCSTAVRLVVAGCGAWSCTLAIFYLPIVKQAAGSQQYPTKPPRLNTESSTFHILSFSLCPYLSSVTSGQKNVFLAEQNPIIVREQEDYTSDLKKTTSIE